MKNTILFSLLIILIFSDARAQRLDYYTTMPTPNEYLAEVARIKKSKIKTCSVSAAALNGFVAATSRKSVANATETKRRMNLSVMNVME